MPRSASIGVDGVRGGMGAHAGIFTASGVVRTASGVETFGVETFGGDALKRAGGGVAGRGGVRGLGGGDVASLLTGRSGERTRSAPVRSGLRARCGLRTWNAGDRPSGWGKPTVILRGCEDVRAQLEFKLRSHAKTRGG